EIDRPELRGETRGQRLAEVPSEVVEAAELERPDDRRQRLLVAPQREETLERRPLVAARLARPPRRQGHGATSRQGQTADRARARRQGTQLGAARQTEAQRRRRGGAGRRQDRKST